MYVKESFISIIPKPMQTKGAERHRNEKRENGKGINPMSLLLDPRA